jgi:hypothetical protein
MFREIRITPVLNGWIVKVGCQTVVFDVLQVMLDNIGEYLLDPKETEKRYRESAVNARFTSWEEAAQNRPVHAATHEDGGTLWTDVRERE